MAAAEPQRLVLGVQSLALYPQTIKAGQPEDHLLTTNTCQEQLSSWLEQQPEQWGVVVYDLVRQEKFTFQNHEVFHAASVMKLVSATAVFQWMEENRMELDFWVWGQTLRQKLTQLINQSNNNQWADLNSLVTLKKEEQLLKTNGLNDSDVYTNTMSAEDVFLLLQKIYQGQLCNQEHRDFLLEAMQNTINENRIPAGIPANVAVAHKYGTWQGNMHDAGFVFAENPYLLVVMTNGVPNVESKIAQFSQLVYQIFAQNQCWLK
jgi:beta-lactamase class A